MFEKQGKFYADWRDKKGVRHRKSFQTERAALRFEADQKEAAHPKAKARGLHSPKFSAPASTGSSPRQRTIPSSQKPLLQLRAQSRRAN